MNFNNWKEYKFSDFVSINPTISLKGGNSFSFIEMKDLSEGKRYVHPSMDRKLTGGARFREGNTLFARITPCLENGKIGQAIRLKDGVGFGSTEFLIFEEKQNVSNKNFIYYLACWQEVRKFAEQNMVGTSGRQRVSKDAFEKLELTLPNIEIQQRIASILSSLDDKIELNNQTNQTLETIAQTLFKEMCLPKGDKLPDGWRFGKLGEVAEINMGQSPAGTSYNQDGEGIIFFQGKAEFGFRFPKIDKYTTEPKKYANKFDSLLSVRAPVGTINMATEKCCIGRGLAAISGKNNCSSFAFYLLKSLSVKFEMYNGEGTVFGSINKTDLENIEIGIPPKNVIEEFEKVGKSIDKLVYNNEQETQTLTTLRDSLLPKLMKGEINI